MNIINATANVYEPLVKASDPFLAVFMMTAFGVTVIAFVGFCIYTNWDHERRGRFA